VRSRPASLFLVGALALASCGDDKGGGGVALDEYADRLCEAFQALQSDVADEQEEVAEAAAPGSDVSPEEGKEIFQNFADELLSATENFTKGIEAAGTPDIDDGEQAAQDLEEAGEEAVERLEQFRDDVSDLPTDDEEEFTEAVGELSQELADAPNPFEALEGGELEAALDDTECGEAESDDNGSDDNGDNGGDAVDVQAYANEVCDAVQSLQSTLQDEQTALQTGLDPNATPEEAKAALGGFLAAAVTAAESFADDVAAASVPDTDGGEEAAGAVAAAADQVVDRLREAEDAVAALDTSDEAAFTAATQEIGADLEESFGGDPFDDIDSDDLQAALDQTECADGTEG
jgi:uncharacterized protein Yka (UPF0111/DUF47 family)